ncbi:basic-leucine zipper transcription factor [Phycomyces blakesleeanus NRRL 1555(-)]|uniref:Basic-leucine zipper transcription factor n=1 Tax=Phycomyces blakesleeanus (strain ATCC 8743b / DSM 1359 / FGSC 10004 / NBRC 33097 / NRRL 1555) TaxID=763407 RepID=A0A167Q484_PHYB8|nr:basic-leucine zipper transcription factor [Phycomyces blakesleeanus NRRL 1555(-)]OAD79046.1 basic-leucine zipper transcription factor [Phycomyces blakesleeanus NRRL 1555(-)]|eukprot:XP_018297086.1 basic-leucine zipper transcription factor [Phycomyces blakesleeanus NRRL 1555(-)]
MSSNTQQSKKTKKTTTKKSVQQTAGTAASTRQWEILPSLKVSAELDGTVLSTLSIMSTRLNESHSLLEKVYHNMGAINGQNNNLNHSPIGQALTTGEYIKYRLPTVSRLIHSQTRAVLATMPLTVNEGAFSTSNRPIADVVQSYTHQQAEVKSVSSAVVEEKTRRHILYMLQRAKALPEKIARQNRISQRRSRKRNTVVDLLDYDMLSDIESDEEKNKTRYTPRNRHPLMDEYFTVLKKQRLANKGPDVIGNSVYPIILRNTKLSNEKKASVAAWIHTRQQ